MRRKSTSVVRKRDPASREGLSLRLDRRTKDLIERAARLEGRKVSEFCAIALANAALRTIERREALVLSEADRKAFFDALMTPPRANERLAKAFAAARRRVS